MENVTLDQLRVLQALARTGSVSAAALALHRAQSAVSYALKSLEEALGLPLLDRSGYRARLTPQGEAVLGKGAALLGAAHELEALAAELRGGAEPRLTLLLDAILPVGPLVQALAEVEAQGFPTQINLRVELLGGIVRALEQLSPELVLTPEGHFTVPPTYQREVIGTLTMLPVVAPGHPLARHSPPVPLEEARRHVHLLVTSPPGLQTPVDSGMIGAPRHWNFPDFHTRLEGLRAGLGFAWMPSFMVEPDLRAGKLVPLVLEGESLLSRRVVLLYRARPPLGPTGRYVHGVLCRQAASLPLLPPLAPQLRKVYERS